MDEGQDEAPDLNPEESQDQSSSDSDDDRFYFVRLKIMRDFKRHRLTLHRDEIALNHQIKRLVEELKDAHQACAERDNTIRAQDRNIIELNQENQALKDRCENINSEPQLEKEYQAFLDKNHQEMHEKLVIISHLESLAEEHLITIQELQTKKNNLEVQLTKAVVFDGTHVDKPMSKSGEELPHSYVEVSDVLEAEEEQDPNVDVQTKSWWRRQAEKVLKGMGTFRLHFKGCCGGRRKRRVVQPVHMDMDIAMPSVSDGMPPVSI